jgi:hypothetical protein
MEGRAVRIRTRQALVILLFLALLSTLLYSFWLPQIGLFLNLPDTLGKAEIILIWPGEYLYGMDKAIELYRQGWAPRILMFSGSESRYYETVARLLGKDIRLSEALARYFIRKGIPADAIRVSEVSRDFDIPGMLQREGIRSVILVLGSYYMRRTCREVGEQFRDPPLKLYHVSTFPAYYSPERWWHNRVELKIVFGEYLNLAIDIVR